MSKGYTISVVDGIRSADKSHVGVQLGLACVSHGISVADVAESLGVSRQAVYKWFCGAVVPQAAHLDAIEAYLSSLD